MDILCNDAMEKYCFSMDNSSGRLYFFRTWVAQNQLIFQKSFIFALFHSLKRNKGIFETSPTRVRKKNNCARARPFRPSTEIWLWVLIEYIGWKECIEPIQKRQKIIVHHIITTAFITIRAFFGNQNIWTWRYQQCCNSRAIHWKILFQSQTSLIQSRRMTGIIIIWEFQIRWGGTSLLISL